jgi:hypothetical protein
VPGGSPEYRHRHVVTASPYRSSLASFLASQEQWCTIAVESASIRAGKRRSDGGWWTVSRRRPAEVVSMASPV